MINTMLLRFRGNMQMSLPKVCCMYIGPLSSMKYETFIQSLNGDRLYTAKKACKVRFRKKLSFISVYRNL